MNLEREEMPTLSQRRLWLWGPVVAYMAAIFFASSLENPPVPSDVPDINLHAVEYFGLMLLAVRAVAQGSWAGVTFGALATAWLLTVAYGASDEWHQMYVDGRNAEWRDLAADSLGALAGGFVVRAWLFLRTRSVARR
jgi:VanZ family protein